MCASAKSHSRQFPSLKKVASGGYSAEYESRQYKGSKKQAERICASGRARRDYPRHRSRPSRRGTGSTGGEPLRPGEQLRVYLMIEHVEEQSTGELLVQPSGLTYSARTEQEEALPRRRLHQSWVRKSFYHVKKT